MINFLGTLKPNDKYVFMHNGVIEKTNLDFENKKNIQISSDLVFILVHLIDSNCDINIELKENIKAEITEVFLINKNVVVNKNINCLKNSELKLVTFEHNINEDICVNVKTTLEDYAYINTMRLATYLSNVVETEKISLNGKKSHIENLNVFLNSCNTTQNFDLNVTHIGEDSESKMTNYGICKGKSILNINTNGIVLSKAIRSNINQKSKGILLDKECSISANPWLQIDEYDCLASHGAGIGAIDDEELYYLMSRGLTDLESEKLIINGFVNPIYEEVKNQELKEKIMEIVEKYL